MLCPNPSCQSLALEGKRKSELVMSERSGIEIDYCPHCRGIWLDRGELDKLLEKAARESEPATSSQPRDTQGLPDSRSRYDDRHSHRKHDSDKYRHSGSYRRKSLLSELFDF